MELGVSAYRRSLDRPDEAMMAKHGCMLGDLLLEIP